MPKHLAAALRQGPYRQSNRAIRARARARLALMEAMSLGAATRGKTPQAGQGGLAPEAAVRTRRPGLSVHPDKCPSQAL